MQSLEAARPGISQESKETSVTTRVAGKEEGDVGSGQVVGLMGIERELYLRCDGRPQADRSQNQGVLWSGGQVRSGAKAEGLKPRLVGRWITTALAHLGPLQEHVSLHRPGAKPLSRLRSQTAFWQLLGKRHFLFHSSEASLFATWQFSEL